MQPSLWRIIRDHIKSNPFLYEWSEIRSIRGLRFQMHSLVTSLSSYYKGHYEFKGFRRPIVNEPALTAHSPPPSSSTMTILVTGGSGYTASALSRLLNDSNHPFIVASRSGQVQGAYPAVTLDFRKPETYNNPFKMDRNIDRVYVVPPQGHSDTMPDLGNFIDFAVSKGVKRIVLLSSSPFGAEHVTMGIAHRHLLTAGIDFTVLRPTWFMRNLSLDIFGLDCFD